MTQKSLVLNELRKRNSVTPVIAFKSLSVYRLASVINLLREDGHGIVNTRRMGKTANYVLTYDAEKKQPTQKPVEI